MNYFNSIQKILAHPENRDAPVKTIIRLLWWKTNQLIFKLPVLYPLTQSTKILCEPESSYGSYIVYARFPEYEEMRFIHDYLRENDVFIDVGANIGAVSLVAADKITRGSIYAFEPTPEIAKKCKKNVSLNKLERRISVLSTAVSDQIGFVQFVIEGESEVNHMLSQRTLISDSKIIDVPSVTLDSFIVSRKIRKISLLKVDVEGAEYKVFAGGNRSFKNHKIEVVVFEVNSKSSSFGIRTANVVRFLKSHGYTLYNFSESGKLLPFNINTISGNTINLTAVAPTKSAQERIKFFTQKDF